MSVLGLAAALACTSSPTEPKGGGGGTQSPKPPTPSVTFNITVTANPSQLTALSPTPSNISVNVVRTDTGQPPADGSAIHVTTTLGNFNSAGGPNAIDLTLVGGHAAATLFATTDTGTAAVTATFQGSAGATNVRIGEPATFFVSSVSPGVGGPNGGDTVTILGGGFVAPVRVTFDGATATVKSTTGSAITVLTPSAAAAGHTVGVGQTASVTVAVTINVNKVNEAVDSIAQGFTYALGGGTQQPSVFSVTPTLGTNDGGTLVTIVGDGFVAPVQVLFGLGGSATSFNGVEATVQSVTPTKIVAVTPAARGFGQNLTNQVVNLLVKNVNTGFSTVATQAFKYGSNVLITAMTQGTGSYLGGTRTSIQGSGFDDPVAVSFTFGGIGIAQQAVSVTGTQIVVLTSPAPLSGSCPANGIISSTAVSVTNIDNGDRNTAPIGFNFQVPLPQISSISPGGGGVGATVTLTGSGFSTLPNNVHVIFGDPANGSTAPNVHVLSETTVTATVPNPPQGFSFDSQACTVGSNTGTQKIPTAVNVTVQNLDTTCLATLRNGFLLTPPDGSCQVTPTPPTAPTASFTSQVLNAATHQMQFIDTSTGGPTSWAWVFFGTPGPATSTAQNPVQAFPAPGIYNVKLTVTNAGGSSSVTQQVTVP
ncbi:MAG TPA: IPT/TIG domain-containing protein [Thermoanaerobaculia bacterium]|nr:IPT/TIG domain-containing protein [Thermoanaerobaculia bacterium]